MRTQKKLKIEIGDELTISSDLLQDVPVEEIGILIKYYTQLDPIPRSHLLGYLFGLFSAANPDLRDALLDDMKKLR